MRLVLAGTPSAALPSLTALLDSPRHEVVAVVTRPDAPTGRGRQRSPSPVAQLAEQHGLPVLRPQRPSEPAFLEQLRELRPDCCPVIAYGALLPRVALDVPPRGWLNLHFSLLPAWRGAAPVPAAIRHGDDVTGVTAFQLDDGMDTGPTYGIVTEPIGARDTAGELLERLACSGARLLTATLDGIEDGTLEARSQPAEGVSYAPKVTVADAEVSWSAAAPAVDRRIRSVTPSPGAWTTFRGERVGLGPVQPVELTAPADLAPGELRAEKRRVLVGTGGRAVELGEVRPPGRRAVAASDWARGARIKAGERLG